MSNKANFYRSAAARVQQFQIRLSKLTAGLGSRSGDAALDLQTLVQELRISQRTSYEILNRLRSAPLAQWSAALDDLDGHLAGEDDLMAQAELLRSAIDGGAGFRSDDDRLSSQERR